VVQINLVPFAELIPPAQLDLINFVVFGVNLPPHAIPTVSVDLNGCFATQGPHQAFNPFANDRGTLSIHAISAESHLNQIFSRAYLAYLIAADAGFDASLKQYFNFNGPLTRDIFAQQGKVFFENTIFPMFAVGAKEFIDIFGKNWTDVGSDNKYRKLEKYVGEVLPKLSTPPAVETDVVKI
jgi:hypothetical protein